MLFRQIKISQVKCNFCLEWMSLTTDIKFNINICDHCLAQGLQQNNLRAVSSKGVLYQLYMIKQNTVIQSGNTQRTSDNWFQDIQQGKSQNEEPNYPKTQFLEQIDEYRNTEIKDILEKWNILIAFLTQKQSLTNDQIAYLKKVCCQKSADLRKAHENLTQSIINQKESLLNEKTERATQNSFDNVNLEDKSKVQNKKKDLLKITKEQDKQNILHSPVKKIQKEELHQKKNQVNNFFNSPTSNQLKQRDLNCFDIRLCKIKQLEQNNETYSKRLNTSFNTSFYDEEISLNSSCIKDSFIYARNSVRSSRAVSIFNSLSKRSNNQFNKKFQATKNRISKYLQKNYQSNSLSRLMFSIVFEAHQSTSIVGKSLQLVSYNLSYIDFKCYLQSFDWSGIEILKLVKTKLSDDQLMILLDFIITNKIQIKILVLTSNKLTQASINHLYDLDLDSIKEIYLGKNSITKVKVRGKINELRNKYSLYL